MSSIKFLSIDLLELEACDFFCKCVIILSKYYYNQCNIILFRDPRLWEKTAPGVRNYSMTFSDVI